MAITNNMGVWGTENDYGSSWYTVSQGRIEGFQPNAINYASKMNQAFKNATLLSYTFAQILAEEVSSSTFTIGAQEVTNLSTFVTNMKSAINSYLSGKSVYHSDLADNSTYATKIGTSSSHPTIGSSTSPVYVNSSGTITQGSTYAGGTKVTLNGTDKGANTANIYAPTTAGTVNQIVKVNNNGIPVFADIATYTPVKQTANTTTTLSADKTYLIVPTPGASITLTQYIKYYVQGSENTFEGTKTTTIYGPMWINTYKVEQEATIGTQLETFVESTITSGLTTIDLKVRDNGNHRFDGSRTNTIRITSSSAYVYYDMTVSV